MSFQKDYEFGTMNEDRVLDILNEKFGVDGEIRKVHNKYCAYDFIGNHYCYELKSRNIKKDDFDTTLLPKSKCCRDNLIFLFDFTDGLYYIQYDPTLFSKFETKPFKRNPRTGYIDREKDYIYIPTEHLTKIE